MKALFNDGSFHTMTVGELKKQLEKAANDVPVIASYEGIFAPITPDRFEETSEDQDERINGKAIIIDVTR